jgi:uncharacterized protein (TIGR00251 family)
VSLASCLQTTFEEGVLLSVEVQAGAHHNQIGEVNAWRSRLNVAVRAQAQKGMANTAVLECLSTSLNLPRSSLSIVSGHTSKKKTVKFENISEKTLLETLREAVGTP